MNAPVGSSPRVDIETLNAEGVSASALRDMALIERVKSIHTANDGVYGVGKMWHALHLDGIAIGRDQTARLMRLAGVAGRGKGRSPVTTRGV